MILDTNALSAFIDGEPAVGVRLSAESQVAIPVIVLGEFRYGISGSRYRDKYERWLADHLSDFEILTVKALGFIPFEKVSLLGGVGYFDADANIWASGTALGISQQASDQSSDVGAMLVGGLEFNLERVDIRAELEWFDVEDAEASGINVGVLFHF